MEIVTGIINGFLFGVGFYLALFVMSALLGRVL